MERTALITCATRFAGRPAARALLAQGVRVVMHDEAFADDSARRAFEQEVPGVTAFAAQGYDDIAARAVAVHGGIDIFVSNDAYPATRAPLEEASAAAYREALEALTVRPLAIARGLVPGMKARGWGRIVLVSSAAPLRGLANYSMYVSARAACNGLVSSWAKELGRKGITVNAVGSNYVENPDYFPPELLADKAAMVKMTAGIPLGRLGKPEEIAAAIAFLASDGAGFITGHVLPHAGGWA
ncbi:MAG: SDR family oxidoreductase [Reyranellaceae bacterium]